MSLKKILLSVYVLILITLQDVPLRRKIQPKAKPLPTTGPMSWPRVHALWLDPKEYDKHQAEVLSWLKEQRYK